MDAVTLALAKGYTKGIVADEYDSTATYSVGDYCINGGTLYKCNTAISSAEPWTVAHWTATQVADELGSGGGNLYQHNVMTSWDSGTLHVRFACSIVTDSSEEFTSVTFASFLNTNGFDSNNKILPATGLFVSNNSRTCIAYGVRSYDNIRLLLVGFTTDFIEDTSQLYTPNLQTFVDKVITVTS